MSSDSKQQSQVPAPKRDDELDIDPATGRKNPNRDKRTQLHARLTNKGVAKWLYWPVRVVLQPFFFTYWRLTRIGREFVPHDGALIVAANHRSFLDPFVIATLSRRPMYFVAKKELFQKPAQRWFLNSLGAFPIDRGNADGDAMSAARTILERGDAVVIFPEGTRNRPGGLGAPKRGFARLALETGAPILPVAVHGTAHIRTGWKIRPHKVTVRAGRLMSFPKTGESTSQQAYAITERVWPCVELLWKSLGGHETERGIGVSSDKLRPELEHINKPTGDTSSQVVLTQEQEAQVAQDAGLTPEEAHRVLVSAHAGATQGQTPASGAEA